VHLVVAVELVCQGYHSNRQGLPAWGQALGLHPDPIKSKYVEKAIKSKTEQILRIMTQA
jgi:hypothetical protein